MKDLGNKVRYLGRYYEVFGEIASAVAMDMKTKTAGHTKSGSTVTIAARPADSASMKDLGRSDPLPRCLLDAAKVS
jgi:hypothetical protein